MYIKTLMSMITQSFDERKDVDIEKMTTFDLYPNDKIFNVYFDSIF